MLAEVGFNRDLAEIDWQLELRPLFCSFWRHRIPPLRSHLLTPILDLCLAVEKFRCLGITLLVRNPPFSFWCRFSLFCESVDQLMSLRRQLDLSVCDARQLPLMPAPVCSPELVQTAAIFVRPACENIPGNSLYQQSAPELTGFPSLLDRIERCVVKETVDVPVWITKPVNRPGFNSRFLKD
jgi:hypothetical protein